MTIVILSAARRLKSITYQFFTNFKFGFKQKQKREPPKPHHQKSFNFVRVNIKIRKIYIVTQGVSSTGQTRKGSHKTIYCEKIAISATKIYKI